MEDRTVLMIHGAGGGAWEWNVWRAVFEARGWRVHAIELQPGAAGIAATTLADYRAQVVAAVGAAGSGADRPTSAGDRWVLIGASLGGLLATMAASDTDPRALVLLNPMPPAPWHSTLPSRAAYDAIVPWGRDASLIGTRRAMPDADDATCWYAYQRWRDESGAVMNAARAGVAVEKPACPTLLIASECDDDVPAATTRSLANAWGCAVIDVPGASHVGLLLGKSAATTAEAALSWLAIAESASS